ncbi:MAG TPA: tyrosine-type recombinase/integrase [Dehalococcoidia bacterium]|nr:tyrosine-type recombinase/integrase [Dehalococcoidia bacterium]
MTGISYSLVRLTESYAFCLSTEGKSTKTIKWYTANLKRFAQFLSNNQLPEAVTEITKEEARQFISHLQTEVTRWEDHSNIHDDKRLSAYSVHGYARTIKAFWSWLLAEGYITRNPMTSLKPPKTPRKVISTFSLEQIQKILNAIDKKSSHGFRNFTMILLLLDTGIRLSELINLQMNDIDFLQSFIIVKGKGNKERVVPFGSQVRRTLRRYIMHFRPEPDSPRTNELFLTEDGLPLKSRAVQSMLLRLSKKAKMSGVRLNPHRFRHTFAKQYLVQGGDIFSLQKILGHSSLEVVRMYVNLITSDILEQHRKFSPVDNTILPRGNKST